jgi:hypothetical protein
MTSFGVSFLSLRMEIRSRSGSQNVNYFHSKCLVHKSTSSIFGNTSFILTRPPKLDEEIAADEIEALRQEYIE